MFFPLHSCQYILLNFTHWAFNEEMSSSDKTTAYASFMLASLRYTVDAVEMPLRSNGLVVAINLRTTTV